MNILKSVRRQLYITFVCWKMLLEPCHCGFLFWRGLDAASQTAFGPPAPWSGLQGAQLRHCATWQRCPWSGCAFGWLSEPFWPRGWCRSAVESLAGAETKLNFIASYHTDDAPKVGITCMNLSGGRSSDCASGNGWYFPDCPSSMCSPYL